VKLPSSAAAAKTARCRSSTPSMLSGTE
jgi:hypothetical protein